jgi:hypothetical protein
MTDQNNPNNPNNVEDAVILEDAEGTEVVETEEEIKEAVEYATPNAESEETTTEETAEEIPAARHATPNAVSSILNLESLINGYLVDLEKAQEKFKTQREMFNDAFNNDAEYSQIMQKVKEVNRVKSAAKQRIMKLPNVVELTNKMREYKEEVKDITEGLSSYLQQYKELSGSNQLTRDNGEVVEIISVTKFTKRKG